MTPVQHDQYVETMKNTITETIEKVVNGKIKSIDEKLSTFAVETRNWRHNEFAQYVKDDLKWKEDAAPVIKAGNSLYSVGRMTVIVVAGLATVIGGWAVIKASLISLLVITSK